MGLYTVEFLLLICNLSQRVAILLVYSILICDPSQWVYTVFAFKMASVVRRLYMVADMMEVM